MQHKCPFVPKGDAQKGEDYTEYRALLPIDNIENGDEYIAALRWAFENKKIRNIALTGPYGSGKSSIIETFLTEDEEAVKKKGRLKRLLAQNKVIRKSALKISMATFEKGNPTQDGKNELISVNEDEVEKGILKQLFYKVEPGKIPQSRYRKLHKIRRLTVFRNIAIGLILISLLVAIFGASIFEKYIRAITDFLPARFSAPVFTVMMMALLLIVLSGVGSYLYITVISRFKVKEVKLPTDTTVQSDNETPDSVFNKNLDEIMYFFESTGYRTVFFEDLDRLTDPKIFVHLRELNNLLNNDDAIRKRPIVFVYAVRDDIFSREDRTKFFDFIIPVIPVINSTNSGEILLQMLQKAAENDHKHEVSEGLVLDVAPYISDMRVLRNIYNEFVVYKKTLRTAQGLSLSDEQMLAMMVFKNLYPNDFADIQDEKGIIKTAFLDKQVFLAKKQQELQKRIDTYTDTITGAQQDAMKTIRELKYAMVGTFMEGFHEFEGFSVDFSYHPSIAAEVVMHDDFDMTELLKKGCKHICVYVYNRGSQCYKIDTTSLNSYIERWKRIKEVSEKGLQNLQEELQELRDEQHSLSGMTFVQMLFKQYKLYCEDGKIDHELLELETCSEKIDRIPSLRGNKYIYTTGDESATAQFLLFSNQSVLGWVESCGHKYETLYELLRKETVRLEDFANFQKRDLQWLIQRNLLTIDPTGVVIPAWKKVRLLKDLYDKGVIVNGYYSDCNAALEELQRQGFIRCESSLFSVPEQQYLNFMLNQAEYSNGHQLRNKYVHGSYPLDETKQQQDYIELLKIMVLIIIKINEEFCFREDHHEQGEGNS